MATGHEREFRRLFVDEAEQRLSRLGRELLALEQHATPELVDSLFRDAHTLKGSGAMVGLPGVSAIAHAMEDLLAQVRAGTRTADAALVDALLAAVDGLAGLLPDLVDGPDRTADAESLAEALRAVLRGEAPAPPPADAPPPAPHGSEPERDAPFQPSPERDAPFQPSPERDAPFQPSPERDAPFQPSPERDAVRVPVERLDELVRLVGEAAAATLRVGRGLADRLGPAAPELGDVRILGRILGELQERALRARMVPVSTITDPLQRAVRDLARRLDKRVRWEVAGADTELDRHVLEQLADPLLHLVRNAVDHAVEPPDERRARGKPVEAVIRLHAMQLGSEVVLAVSDDGRGIDVGRVRAAATADGIDTTGLDDDAVLDLVFRSGVSTVDVVSDVSGRGVGLDVVRTALDSVRGRVEVRTTPGLGSEFRLRVPITLVVLPSLLVAAGGQTYALPLADVLVASDGRADGDVVQAGGGVRLRVGGDTVPVRGLAATLGLGPDREGPLVVVGDASRRHAFAVDRLLGQRDVVVTSLGRLLPRLPAVAGASVEPDGSVLLVLDAAGLIDLAGSGPATPAPEPSASETRRAASTILVVDDALTVRELQRAILERAGYDVRVASDGEEALARLAEGDVDLVLTDLEMPRLDGLGLTEAIRARPSLAGMPVVILTSRGSEADRRRGLEAGANAYVVKSAFDQIALLDTVERLLGAP